MMAGRIDERIDYAFGLRGAEAFADGARQDQGVFPPAVRNLASAPGAIHKLFSARLEGVDPRIAGTWVTVSRALNLTNSLQGNEPTI
jgi:hypothetical protein